MNVRDDQQGRTALEYFCVEEKRVFAITAAAVTGGGGGFLRSTHHRGTISSFLEKNDARKTYKTCTHTPFSSVFHFF